MHRGEVIREGRKPSPSPKASSYFSSSESGDSDRTSRRRNDDSFPLSPTPERETLSKPPRATPDERRGLRSPNPSPLSPRNRVPQGRLTSLLFRDSVGQDVLRAEDITRSKVNDSEHARRGDSQDDDEDGEVTRSAADEAAPDRWVPDEDGEDYYYKRPRWETLPRKNSELELPGKNRSYRREGLRAENLSDRGVGELGRLRRDDVPPGRRRYQDRYSRIDEPREDEHRDVRREDDRNGENKDAKDGEATKVGLVKADASGLVVAEKAVLAEGKVERQRPVLPLGRSGGVYIPPFKLAQMMKDVQDKSSKEYQRLTWDALRKSINGLVNKVNASNVKNILPELFAENLIRGRGLFARSCMKSQMASASFTHVFAALVAVVNTKFPELGELLLKRIILQLRRAFKRNDKPVLLAAAKFIAHLVNQQVAHESLALQFLTVLLENPTDDSVEVAVDFVKECGSVLQNLTPRGLNAIFERFRGILHEGEIDKRVQFMIEGLFALRKAKFQGYPGVLPELDLVEEEDQITHDLNLDDELDDESYLDVFKLDPNFVESEKKYELIKKEILGDELDNPDEDGAADAEKGSEEEEEDEDEDEREQRMQIQDETETDLVNLRRTIYLTIMSSVDFEEAGHKLLKIKLESGQEMELCVMLLECCMQERTYLRYYGLLGQRFCLINRVYQENFDKCFVNQYSMIHRLETNKLRNVAKFNAHLLGTDALPWQALAYIRLTEEDTTSSSRIFIKILFQELSEHLGLRRLNERLSDPMIQESLDGIFPKDNPKNTRFAINFFTSIGLGGLTDNLREYLKNMPRLIMQQHPMIQTEKQLDPSTSSESSSSESESDTVSSSSSSTDVSDSTSEDRLSRHKRRKMEDS